MKSTERRAPEPVIQAYLALGLTEVDLAESLGTRIMTISRWARGVTLLPRQRRVQILSFLVCIGARFEQRAAMTDDAPERHWLTGHADRIAKLQRDELHARRDMVTELESETARVRRELEAVYRVADRLRGWQRH
jgi:transcriptional regulator with XRE-family HTH domain